MVSEGQFESSEKTRHCVSAGGGDGPTAIEAIIDRGVTNTILLHCNSTRALARPQHDLRAANPRASFLQPALRVNRGNPEKEPDGGAASPGQIQTDSGILRSHKTPFRPALWAFFMKLSNQSSPGFSHSVFPFRREPSGSKRSKLPSKFLIPLVETRKCRPLRDGRGRKQLGPWHGFQGRESREL